MALGWTQTVLLTLHPTFHISNVHELCLDRGVVFWEGLGALRLTTFCLKRLRKVCSSDDRGDSTKSGCMGLAGRTRRFWGVTLMLTTSLTYFRFLLFGLKGQLVFQSCHFFPFPTPWQGGFLSLSACFFYPGYFSGCCHFQLAGGEAKQGQNLLKGNLTTCNGKPRVCLVGGMSMSTAQHQENHRII